ncbi:IS701 family transposase [Actinomadura sp. K4S16]|uniref:IS701 family transposase n=1 Tax=Actinomadura sp. K4S16 TaxID=1316147 RepID=UPI0011EF5EA6|nr:IS701 family transposase [Actinomadura sp. K4S16]
MLEDLLGRVACRFKRVETRRRFRGLLEGLLAELPRKNCWTIAEHAGDRNPYGMQYLLSRAVWDADQIRDDLRGYVTEQLGSAGAVLVVDETGDLKKGTCSAGVQRQYTGTAGRIENSQVAVFLGYATDAGHAFLDRELYLPRIWAGDTDRRQAAGVPADRTFATKPELARRMLARALDAGVQAGWATGDEVYGQSPDLRGELEQRGVGYVLAVASSHRVTLGVGTRRADQAAAALPKRAWQPLSAGTGAKGERLYHWALIGIDHHRPGCRWLLVRRNRRTGELAFYRCYAPAPVPLHTLVTVAGRRWTIEESFQAGKGLCGLDQHQVRTWRSWYRWTTMAMLAHAFLTAVTASEHTRPQDEPDLIPVTLAEVQRLMTRLTASPPQAVELSRHWSHWRRRHQAHARTCHHQRQQT